MGTKQSNTFSEIVLNQLEGMEVYESFVKKDFIKKHWKEYNYFVDRSFTVYFSKAKKLLPEKTFKCLRGVISRTE